MIGGVIILAAWPAFLLERAAILILNSFERG
jgi:hypothetical protein